MQTGVESNEMVHNFIQGLSLWTSSPGLIWFGGLRFGYYIKTGKLQYEIGPLLW
jgi:hypothetical protein